MLSVFTLTTFLSAALLFLVQPLFAKMVLPLLGGAPGVWNTAMLFFQTCLLAGYSFAHFGPRLLGARRHAMVQVVVVALPIALLPLSLPAGADPTGAAHPTLWLLGFMTITIGAPFFALSTTSPTLQHWFGASGHARAGNPYFLYVASNLGSLLALLAYPVGVEPFLPLRVQQRLWGVGYGLLALLTLLSAVAVFRRHSGSTAAPAAGDGAAPPAPLPAPPAPPTWADRGLWILGAFIPSSLLLGVTAFVSSEVAAVPLLWVLPLALYLGTFILAFSSWSRPSDRVLRRALAILAVPLVLVIALHQRIQPIAALILLNLAGFFVAALLCHRRLAATRPAPAHLTEFYLWLSIGGVLGGIFNALLAPVLFNTHLEYPLVLLLACLFALRPESSSPRTRRTARLAAAATLVGAVLALVILRRIQLADQPAAPLLLMALPALACFLAAERPIPFTLALAALLFAGQVASVAPGRQLHIARSFFGINRVAEDGALGLRYLYSGITIHGIQSTQAPLRRAAFSYYHDRSPSGRVLAALARTPGTSVGVVGLGAGSLAVYAAPGQTWTFFEIDPVVARIASDPKYFTFLHDAPTPPRLVLGDARLTLAREPAQAFDALVIDAFSSDAIPIHLLTREAFALYASKLKPGGVLLCHISNNHLDLEPIIGGIAADRGLSALTCVDSVGEDRGRMASTWMLLHAGERPAWLGVAGDDWSAARTCAADRIWRDDFSSVLSVLNWR